MISIYVIEADQFVKVGISDAPHVRVAAVATGCPHPPRLVHTIDVLTSEAGRLERAIHRDMAEHRRNGEWFAVSAERAIEAVERIAGPRRIQPTRIDGRWHLVRTPRPDASDAMATIQAGVERDRYRAAAHSLDSVTVHLECHKCGHAARIPIKPDDRRKFRCSKCGVRL